MTPRPHLYAADVRTTPPTTFELPYPFPDGVNPTFVEPNDVQHDITIVDENSAGELLVAVLVPEVLSPNVTTYTLRMAAPHGHRGLVADSPGLDTFMSRINGIRNLVVFYDDPASFVAVDIRYHYPDPGRDAHSISMSEHARRSLPVRVAAATFFAKACPGHGVWDPIWTDPVPIMTVSDDGALELWSFDEEVIDPTGRYTRMMENDCTTLDSSALASFSGPYVPASANIRFADGYVISGSRLYQEPQAAAAIWSMTSASCFETATLCRQTGMPISARPSL